MKTEYWLHCLLDPARKQEINLENQPIDNMDVTHCTLAPFTPDDERDTE